MFVHGVVPGGESDRMQMIRCSATEVHLGEDAATTGAVSGQIDGAFYGVDGIPEGWLEKVAMRERIKELATQLMQTRKAILPS